MAATVSHQRSTLRAIIICPFRQSVFEAEIENSLEELQRIVGGGYIEFGVWINRKDVLYVNDFAHWKEKFAIGKSHMFSGCGVITGGDGHGTNMDKSARVSLQEIRNVVRFPGVIRQQMRK
jgi:hypothetical protein